MQVANTIYSNFSVSFQFAVQHYPYFLLTRYGNKVL